MPASVAIVVRTKDRPHFLRRALGSITAQTMPDWECVIVNDGGDAAHVDEAIAELPGDVRDRVQAVHHPSPRGRWVSANAGVLATTAPLLVLHDDDDSWDPRFLERTRRYLDERPDQPGVVSRIEIIWERCVGDEFTVTGREIFQPQLHDVLLSDTLLFNRFVPIGLLYRRSLHEEIGLYDDGLPVVGDWSFYLRVLSRGPLEYLEGEPLAFWHQRVGEEGHQGNSVIAEGHAHERHDALIRDEMLREHISEHGMGLALYLTKFIDRRFVEVENGIRGEIAAQHARDQQVLDEHMHRLQQLVDQRPLIRLARAVQRRLRRLRRR